MASWKFRIIFSVKRENFVIPGRSVLCLSTLLRVFVVILVFQLPVKYHYNR